MPAIVRTVTASSENVLEGLKFSVLRAPALLSLYASGANEGDTVSMSVGDQEILVQAEVNVEAASGVVDTDRDGLLIQERVPAGKLYLGVDLTTSVKYLLIIESIV